MIFAVNLPCMLVLNRDHTVSTNCDTAKTKIQKGKKNTKSQSSKHSWIPKFTVFVSHSKFTIVAYFFIKVVAMVTKPKAKFVFSDDIFPISSHQTLRISSFFVYMKFCAKPHLVLN